MPRLARLLLGDVEANGGDGAFPVYPLKGVIEVHASLLPALGWPRRSGGASVGSSFLCSTFPATSDGCGTLRGRPRGLAAAFAAQDSTSGPLTHLVERQNQLAEGQELREAQQELDSDPEVASQAKYLSQPVPSPPSLPKPKPIDVPPAKQATVFQPPKRPADAPAPAEEPAKAEAPAPAPPAAAAPAPAPAPAPKPAAAPAAAPAKVKAAAVVERPAIIMPTAAQKQAAEELGAESIPPVLAPPEMPKGPAKDECGCAVEGPTKGGWNSKTVACEAGRSTEAYARHVCESLSVPPRSMKPVEVEVDKGPEHLLKVDASALLAENRPLLLVMATTEEPPAEEDVMRPPVPDLGTG
eukprot:TRINITY_DN28192_c0_g1_i1.p1 TRINITY_DN28192_c0_g1~~TRINITY_DN28192_c0_g1_i1.p1  ORF type:complete len:355 (-),score=99.99 TRINITY_DN28192_c0_g1_i1:44-1108(-)